MKRSEKMKAIICTKYGRPERLQLKEVEKPVPADNEILVKIHAANVSISDCIVRSGKVKLLLWLPMRIFVGFKRPRRAILGFELAGTIEATGQKVKRFKPGMHVIAFTGRRFGAYAEYICLPENGTRIPTDSVVIEKPDVLSWEEAAAIPTRSTLALHFLEKANIGKGKNVLVFGASGGVGTYAIQLAKNQGANVTGVCSTSNMEWVRSLGADQVIDYTKEDFTKGNVVYDIIFDAVGKKHSASLQYKKVLARNGQFISVDTGNPKIHVNKLNEIIALAGSGKLITMIDRKYTLEQTSEAHAYVEKGHKKGHVVITIE